MKRRDTLKLGLWAFGPLVPVWPRARQTHRSSANSGKPIRCPIWSFPTISNPASSPPQARLRGPLGYISPATAERNFYNAELTAKIAAE